MFTFTTFLVYTLFVAVYAWYRLRKEKLTSQDGYFLGGRSLTGVVIAGSILLTNISTEHLIGMNGSSYKNGFIVIGWEVTSSLALVAAAVYFIPKYLKMGLTTIPEYLENRFDGMLRSYVAFFLMISFVVTLLPIVLYTGAINLESIFNISEVLEVSKKEALLITVVSVGLIGSLYAILGGLKAVAISDTINGYGLLLGGLAVPLLALLSIGEGNPMEGLTKVFNHAPTKFNVIGTKDSVLPFEVLFTGLIVNQIYFWCMNQTIIQRALAAKNLKEAQKGLLFTGLIKIFIPLVIILPGIIGFYYFGDSLYENQDMVYPEIIKKVLPASFVGIFAAIVMGAVLSTFNSVLNSSATIFSIDLYKRHFNPNASDKRLVYIGKITSSMLAIFAILVAPIVSQAPDGLYQLLQQLNGIFFIPIASIMLVGFFTKNISALAAKVALFVGLTFYLLMSFVFDTEIHFVHIWGIEFILNLIVMYIISCYYPNKNKFKITDLKLVKMEQWKYTKPFSIFLCVVTLIIYITMGSINS